MEKCQHMESTVSIFFFLFQIDCGVFGWQTNFANIKPHNSIVTRTNPMPGVVTRSKWKPNEMNNEKKVVQAKTINWNKRWKNGNFILWATAAATLWLSGAPTKYCLYAIFKDNEKSRTICINFFYSLPPTSIHISFSLSLSRARKYAH